MADIIGPASAPFSVTTRPLEKRVFGLLDTFFKDCTAAGIKDGTEVQANWLNGILGVLRSVWRMNGLRADGTTPVVIENGTDDDGLSKSLQQLVQRGQPTYAVDTGLANAMAVSLSPALIEYKAGLLLKVKVKVTNTGPTTLTVNGLGLKAVKLPSGADLPNQAIIAGGIALLDYDGTVFQLAAMHSGGAGSQGPQGVQGPQGPAGTFPVNNGIGAYALAYLPSGMPADGIVSNYGGGSSNLLLNGSAAPPDMPGTWLSRSYDPGTKLALAQRIA